MMQNNPISEVHNRKIFTIAFLISAATIIVYIPALQNGFVLWDDNLFVYENVNIRSINSAFFRWMFTTYHTADWFPLTWLSHAIDYAIWELNPMGHHLTSIILHGLNTFVVVTLIVRLINFAICKHYSFANTKESRLSFNTSIITGAATGLLFGLHPLHVESVAWASERKDVLYSFFYLLSILFYLKYITSAAKPSFKYSPEDSAGREPRRITKEGSYNYIICLLFFVLSLMSKSMAVTLPVVLVILDVYPFERLDFKSFFLASKRNPSQAGGISPYSVLREKIPFVLLSLAVSVVAIIANQAEGAMMPIEFQSLWDRILTACRAPVFYLVKMIWPADLVPFYPLPRDISFFSISYAGSFILFFSITFFCIWMWRQQRIWAILWAYYLVTLLPVLGIVQSGGQSAADRYTYLPGLGPFLLIGLGISYMYNKYTSGEYRFKHKAKIIFIPFILAICIFTVVTLQQIKVWKNSFTLWNVVIRNFPDCYIAYRGIGVAYEQKGEHDNALWNFNKAIELNPADYLSYLNRGKTFEHLADYKKAVENFHKAAELNPELEQAYYNLGVIYDYYFHNYREAIEYYSKAIEFDPGYSRAYNNRGVVYATAGNYREAIKDFTAVITINNKDSDAYFNRAHAFRLSADQVRAVSDFKTAAQLGNKEAQKYLKSQGTGW